MNYIELINRFWVVNIEYSFTGNETKLYYYLVHISNSLGWKNPFRQSDSQISVGAGMSVNSIKSARNRLKQSGLISFKGGKQGNQKVIANKTLYRLLDECGVAKNDSPMVCPVEGSNDEDEVKPVAPGPKKPKPPRKVKKEFDLSFVDVVYLSLVKEFIDYRRTDIKKPYKTERGIKQFYNELLKLSKNNYTKAKELVDYAKGKEWQTIYPIKTNEADRSNNTSHTPKQQSLEEQLIAEANALETSVGANE